MATITEKLYLPYNELSHFLEKMPDGMTYDLLQTKIPSLRALSKKELAQLLDYVKTKNRITVTPVTRKGTEASPHLRHKKYTAPLNVIAETPAEKTATVVHIASLGKPAMSTQKETSPAVEKEVTAGPLADVVSAVKTKLINSPAGLTRTELARRVSKYHKLDALQRLKTLTYLREHEGVMEVNMGPDGLPSSVTRFITPENYHKLVEKTSAYLPASNVVVSVKRPTAAELDELVLALLAQSEGGSLPFFRLANYIPALDALSFGERQELVSRLVEEGKLFSYQDTHPLEDHRQIQWVALEEPAMVVKQFGDINPTTAMGEALRAAEQNSKQQPAEVQDSPVAENVTPPGQSSLDVRKQILELEALARTLEEKEKNTALLNTIKPIRDEIVKEFVAAQDALTAQIDALAALGSAIEKLNAVIGE